MTHERLLAEVERWPEAMRSAWLERAAIQEFDAGLSREKAELSAYYAIKRLPITAFRQFKPDGRKR